MPAATPVNAEISLEESVSVVIYLKPGEEIVAFRIDGGPWLFDEGFLKLWLVAADEVPKEG